MCQAILLCRAEGILMEKLKYIQFGLACGVLASGLILLISTPPRGVPIQHAPPPTPSP